jgi:hypothetical protein
VPLGRVSASAGQMSDADVKVHGGEVLRKRILLSVLASSCHYLLELTMPEQKLVRSELDSLLMAKPPYGRTPSPSQLAAFASEWKHTGHGAKACDATTADFMIDIAGKPKSPWNVSAGRIFVSHLIEKLGYDDTEEMRMAIEKAFSNRIKSLKSRHGRDKLSNAEKAAERSKHSRNQRKYQVIVVSFIMQSQSHITCTKDISSPP